MPAPRFPSFTQTPRDDAWWEVSQAAQARASRNCKVSADGDCRAAGTDFDFGFELAGRMGIFLFAVMRRGKTNSDAAGGGGWGRVRSWQTTSRSTRSSTIR